MKTQNLEDWKNNLYAYITSLNEQLKSNKSAREIYYGFEVIDGALINSPEILFIGINPGRGSGDKHYSIKFDSERISYLDYFDEEYNYPLAKETIQLFRLAGLNDDEIIHKLNNNCVKTNLYHIVTNNVNDIPKAINSLDDYNFGDYYKNSVEYCMTLIQILKPKIVIFEGKGPYDEIIEVCYEKYNTWDKNLGIGEYYSESEKLHYIGYSRLFSNIKNIEALALKLKNIL